ncbi:MAG: hypothetical protein SGPRY_009028 [Prymnesium sp.]
MCQKRLSKKDGDGCKLPKGTVFHPCNCSASDYWRLRYHNKNGFDRFRAAADGNRHEVLLFDEDEQGFIKRVSKVSANVNPVPRSMRKMLGVGDEFYFKITECWWKDKYDGDHPLTMITEPAVMADKIVVTGQEWVEPTSETTCNLWFQLTVKIYGVGSTIAKGISDGTVSGYASIPKFALEYLERLRIQEESGVPSPIRVKSPVLENIITPEDDSLGAPWYTRFSTAVPNERCSTPRVLAEGLIYIAASERASLIQRSIRNRRISARTRAQSYRHSEDTPESTPPPVKRVNSFPTISASKSNETLPANSSPSKEMEQQKSGREQDRLFDDRLQQAASDDATDSCNRDDCDGPVVELQHSHSLSTPLAVNAEACT